MLRALQEVLGNEQLMLTYLGVFIFESVVDHEFIGHMLRAILHFRFSLRILGLLRLRNHLIIFFIGLSTESETTFKLSMMLFLIGKSDGIVKKELLRLWM